MKKIAGTGSYADSRGPADMSLDAAKKYKDYGWALNWDSTARFPWHGEWLPTAADGFGESWLTCFAHGPPDQHTNEGCKTVSYAEIDSWYRHINKMGAAVGTEFSSCQYGALQDSRWNLAALSRFHRSSCGGQGTSLSSGGTSNKRGRTRKSTAARPRPESAAQPLWIWAVFLRIAGTMIVWTGLKLDQAAVSHSTPPGDEVWQGADLHTGGQQPRLWRARLRRP